MQQDKWVLMSREKQVRIKSAVIPRRPWAKPPVTSQFPGHDGPRPRLSFVLKTLAGDDSGMTEMHLSDSNAQRTFKEAWERVFADPLSTQIAKNSMIAMMRYLADLWIDSGKSGEGENRVDNPSRRNVEYKPPAGTAPIVLKSPEHPRTFLSFWNPSEITQEPPKTFGSISIDDGRSVSEIDALYKETPVLGWNAFAISSGEAISELFYRLVGDEKRWPQIHKDGTQSLKELIFGFDLETFNSAYRFVLHHFGTKVAMYWFAKLLDSPFSRLLARCDDCGTYFAYERVLRTDIKGGTHCRNCKGCGSAKRMNRTRDKRNDSLVRFAAEFYGQFKPNSRQPLTKWIAEHVNRRTGSIRAKAGKETMSHYPVITGRWVTLHLTEIEAEVERGKHATREN
jgi:hypothetical protein